MSASSRREFLVDVGRGMLVAGVGSTLASELGLSHAFADEVKKELTFDKLEPLVVLMQETPIGKLLTTLKGKLDEGVELRMLVAAGALANARTFGGQDYTGYHAFMALPPALQMSETLPKDQKALPVLKVLYRNTDRIRNHGGRKNEVLHPITQEVTAEAATADTLRAAARKADFGTSEAIFAKLHHDKPSDAYDALQQLIQDEVDVHRVVLSWRAWTMLDITGKEHAHTLLRQSVRYCVDSEKRRIDAKRPVPGVRDVLPKLLDEHKLLSKGVGKTKPNTDWVTKFAETVYGSSRDKAAEAVAMALAEGMDPEAIGEAISLASCFLVLRDPGRKQDEDGKPKGSCHGASVGVHASDSANAWRNIARVSNTRNTVASLIVGAYHTAGQSGGQLRGAEVYPQAAKVEKITEKGAEALLKATAEAIEAKDQALACALVQQYGTAGHDAKGVFEVMIRYAMSQDGALHAEKYYRTVCEEFAQTRAELRWNHMVALARVTASEFGFPAPGYADACKLMKG